jgi:hypothetical protein
VRERCGKGGPCQRLTLVAGTLYSPESILKTSVFWAFFCICCALFGRFSALFSRLLDRLFNKRLEGVVSRLGMRSPTQCGFRPGHGALDAIFTLQHLITAAQHNKHRLFAVFVDL